MTSNMISFKDLYFPMDLIKVISQLIYLVQFSVERIDDLRMLLTEKVIILESKKIEIVYENLWKVSKLLESSYMHPKICENIWDYKRLWFA